MSAAQGAVRAAVVARLKADPTLAGALNGVFDGPAVRASTPFAEVAEAAAGDWSTKDQRGREVRVAITLRDEAETPTRIGTLAEAVEEAILAIDPVIDGWRIASLAFLRSRLAADAPGRWIAVSEFRLRVLEA